MTNLSTGLLLGTITDERPCCESNFLVQDALGQVKYKISCTCCKCDCFCRACCHSQFSIMYNSNNGLNVPTNEPVGKIKIKIQDMNKINIESRTTISIDFPSDASLEDKLMFIGAAVYIDKKYNPPRK